MAKFSKGDKVESVKTGAKGVVDEVYGDEKYAVLFDGATNPDKVEGFQIKAANGCARNSAAARSTNSVVQNAINARRARNAKAEFVQPYVRGDVTDNGVSIRLIKLQDEIKDATADGCAAKAFQQIKLLREVANSLEKVAKWMGSLA